jgi:hypothetical protein
LILLISNIANDAAPAWINSFPAGAVSLITASDFHLSFKAGIFVNRFSSSSLVVNGYKINPDEISGVITTVSGFSPIEFYYINPADRDYVCTEVNSFINFFLSELKCKKINPPTRRSFSGLSLQKIEWVKIAHKLNIPVQSFVVKNGKYEYTVKRKKITPLSCTIINNKIMEADVNERVHKYVGLLAKEFSLPYLTCYFSTVDNRNFHLLDINSIPDITTSLHRDAIINYF